MLLGSLVLILLALCMTIIFTPFGGCFVVSDNFLSTKKEKEKRKSKWHDACFICKSRDWCKVLAGCWHWLITTEAFSNLIHRGC